MLVELGARLRVDVAVGDQNSLETCLVRQHRHIDRILYEHRRLVISERHRAASVFPRESHYVLWWDVGHRAPLDLRRPARQALILTKKAGHIAPVCPY